MDRFTAVTTTHGRYRNYSITNSLRLRASALKI